MKFEDMATADQICYVLSFMTFVFITFAMYYITLSNTIYDVCQGYRYLLPMSLTVGKYIIIPGLMQSVLYLVVFTIGFIGVIIKNKEVVLIFRGFIFAIVVYHGYLYYDGYTFFYKSESQESLITPMELCMIHGLVLFVPVLGYFLISKNNICTMHLYAFILCMMLVFKLVIVCLTCMVDEKAIQNSFNIPVRDISNPRVTGDIEYIQRTFQCCGSNSYEDYKDLRLPADMVKTLLVKDGVPMYMVPASCCFQAEGQSCINWSVEGCKAKMVKFVLQLNFHIWILAPSICLMLVDIIGIYLVSQLIANAGDVEKQLNMTIKKQVPQRNLKKFRDYRDSIDHQDMNETLLN